MKNTVLTTTTILITITVIACGKVPFDLQTYLIWSALKLSTSNYKSYLRRRTCTPCGKMTHMDNLEMSEDHFLKSPFI